MSQPIKAIDYDEDKTYEVARCDYCLEYAPLDWLFPELIMDEGTPFEKLMLCKKYPNCCIYAYHNDFIPERSSVN